MVSVGMALPKFELPDQDGRIVSPAMLGRRLVIYFYPKDFTPGCTTQADEFTTNHEKFAKKKITVIGISPDGPDSHKKFCAKMKIPYTLLSDSDHAVATKFGVWGKKKFMGREYMGVSRTTFLVNAKGVVFRIFAKVKPRGHADLVLDAFEND